MSHSSRHYSHRRAVAPFDVPGEDIGRMYVTDSLEEALEDRPAGFNVVARDSALDDWHGYCPSCERYTDLDPLECRRCEWGVAGECGGAE